MQSVKTLMKVMPTVRTASPEYQHEYLMDIEVLGDVLDKDGNYREAAMIYAAGINLCQRLGVDATQLSQKRSQVSAKRRARLRAQKVGQNEF